MTPHFSEFPQKRFHCLLLHAKGWKHQLQAAYRYILHVHFKMVEQKNLVLTFLFPTIPFYYSIVPYRGWAPLKSAINVSIPQCATLYS